MSEIKVNKITPRTNCGTTQLGDSGDTFTIPAGATINNQGTATNFGATGAVSWDTTVKTTGFTAVAGTGYFCNTTGGAFTVTLPLSPSAGDVIGVADYAKTFDTDNCTLGRNGSNINGDASDSILTTEGLAVTLVYVDGTKGWITTDTGLASQTPGPLFVTATGGCVTTCGDYKIHTFLSPNTFCVSCAGNAGGANSVDYLVVAGGGGGGGAYGAGAGAGGYRESAGTSSGCYTVSPLGSGVSALAVTATPYAITVGGGGTGATLYTLRNGTRGVDSIFSTITSSGGGAGGATGTAALKKGGSGGGGSVSGPSGPPCNASNNPGTGNTPVQSPAQGTNGGIGFCGGGYRSGGGGGATVAGLPSPDGSSGGCGGAGATSSINATPTARAGGGGGGQYGVPAQSGGVGGSGGSGGGGAGHGTPGVGPGCNGTVNLGGGGGGGAGLGPDGGGGNGGSGIVIIRYKYQ
jgi:hypothetical protein